MRNALQYVSSAIAAFVLLGSGTVTAQLAPGEWDQAIGNPGISRNTVFALRAYDDGTGEGLYAAGSFPSVGGVSSTGLIGRWDRQTNTWSRLGFGLSGSFVNDMIVYDAGQGPELIVAGYFEGAVGVPSTRCLARWNGQAWASADTQFLPNTADSIWGVTVWNGRLYVGGSFTQIGGVPAGGLAVWDGAKWDDLGSGINGSFSPTVFAMATFDDGSGEAVYAAGRFDTVNGVTARMLAKWDGSKWSAVGGGVTPTSTLFGLECFEIFDDGLGPALYVGGYAFIPSGQPTTSVAKWDGQRWSSVGQVFTGRVTALAGFDDGTGPAMHLGGTALPDVNYVARLENGKWDTLGGGVGGPPVPPATFPSVFALRAWGDALYVGGSFGSAGGKPASGLAAWTGALIGDMNCDGKVDFGDINPFVLALTDPIGYQQAFPDCELMNADINQDGRVDFGDINPFVDLLTQP